MRCASSSSPGAFAHIVDAGADFSEAARQSHEALARLARKPLKVNGRRYFVKNLYDRADTPEANAAAGCKGPTANSLADSVLPIVEMVTT